MADYFMPTIIQPTIPIADMTAVEQLLLTQIFDHEPNGDGLYFFAEEAPNELPVFNPADLRNAIQKDTRPSKTADFVRDHLTEIDDDDPLDLDMTMTSWQFIFQDIVARSSTLRHVSVVQSFTCSRMRPDGFGGLAMLITADAVRCKSTDDVLNDFINDYEAGGDTSGAPADRLRPEE